MPSPLEAALDRALDAIYEADPVQATFAGDHRFDGRLSPQSPEARAEAMKRLAAAREAVERTGEGGLGEGERVDREMMLDELAVRLRWEEAVRPAERDPGRVLDD